MNDKELNRSDELNQLNKSAGVKIQGGVGSFEPAECNSAIQQNAILRYESGGVASGRTKSKWITPDHTEIRILAGCGEEEFDLVRSSST